MRAAIVRRPIDLPALLGEVEAARNGASVLFVGTVREQNDGRPVRGIEYAAYEAMAERELAAIVAECCARFGTGDVVAEHRIGHLVIGEASVAIAAAHPHRAQAYEASRYIIEQIKLRLPVWKREAYVDGTREWVGVSREASSVAREPAVAGQDAGAAERGPASTEARPLAHETRPSAAESRPSKNESPPAATKASPSAGPVPMPDAETETRSVTP